MVNSWFLNQYVIHVYIYIIYTYVYIIDKTYAIWVNSLVNLSIKHHQVVKMALWVYHSTWKNSSICGWWTYSTDIRFPQSPAKRWISGVRTIKRLAWFSSDPNNNRWKWWNIFSHFHMFGVCHNPQPENFVRPVSEPSMVPMVPIWCGQFFHLGQVCLCTWHKHNGYGRK